MYVKRRVVNVVIAKVDGNAIALELEIWSTS